jgi:Txe/YoeB family toxin of Txe-Axe toxin-antitoxin module
MGGVVECDPFEGIGKPEPLKGDLSAWFTEPTTKR